jgi:hypothetical protein
MKTANRQGWWNRGIEGEIGKAERNRELEPLSPAT